MLTTPDHAAATDVAAPDGFPLPVARLAAQLALSPARRSLVVVEDAARAEAVARLLTAFAPDATVIHLVASDALPGDATPPSAGNTGQRVAALHRLRAAVATDAAPIVLVLSAEASVARYPAPTAFDAVPPRLAVGDAIDTGRLSDLVVDIGYVVDDRVDEPGEVAIRGSVVDIFPADSDRPVRVAFADGIVTALRRYDPVTQLGEEDVAEVVFGRASDPAMGRGVAIARHLPDAVVLVDPGVKRRRRRLLSLVEEAAGGPTAMRSMVTDAAWARAVAGREQVLAGDGDADAGAPPRFVERRDPLRAFHRFLRAADDTPAGTGAWAIAGSPRDLRFLGSRIGMQVQPCASLAAAAAVPAGTLALLEAPLDRGFAHDTLTVIAAADLLGSRARVDDSAAAAAGFDAGVELRVGDLVVHEDHGIGRVAGIEAVGLGGEAGAGPAQGGLGGDAIVLDYAKGARRLVPVAEASRIWRYGADADAVSLDTLDGGSWIRRRAGIDVAIAESARALQALATERDARTTDPIVPDHAAYERFAAGFPFAETADQARAIAAVRGDLASGRPMDRLIVGDVGYGKTEVALRAAAMVALAGRQVAMVAPTTVLARQHLETFRARFAGTGIEVAGLSRWSGAADRRRVADGLADGSIGIVVGTTSVMAKAVAFHDLALVVIDEEQRFGAKAKEALHAMGEGHVLTLSATPIPRTLQGAMVGLQAISVIATPPVRRQPIRTTLGTFDDGIVAKALRRERARGGQSFVVVPRIEDIAPLADRLARLVPEIGVVVAHGKLDAAELDDAMAGFAAGDGDVLLATNIIEAGLDVPRANTMIVHHSDRFGLSQLHQLRGRVGRGGRRGQILLLTEPDATIAEATVKRLRTLQAFDQLGAGFAISARDLDLRGAGDLVGEEQAGHMKLIGIDLYQHLLAQALHAARGEPADRWQPTVNLGETGMIPADWIPEVDVRLTLYSQIAHLGDIAELDALHAEIEDRFGAIPDAASHLMEAARIGLLARAADIRQVDVGPAAVALTPRDPTAHLPAPFVASGRRWLAKERVDDPVARVARTRALLDDLLS